MKEEIKRSLMKEARQAAEKQAHKAEREMRTNNSNYGSDRYRYGSGPE